MRSSSLQLSAGRSHLNLSRMNAEGLIIVAVCQRQNRRLVDERQLDRGSSRSDICSTRHSRLQPIRPKQCFGCSNQHIDEIQIIEKRYKPFKAEIRRLLTRRSHARNAVQSSLFHLKTRRCSRRPKETINHFCASFRRGREGRRLVWKLLKPKRESIFTI